MQPEKRAEIILWSIIVAYAGVIYATLPVVSAVRKALTERFGYGIFDGVYWVFGALGAACAARLLVRLRGAVRIRALVSLAVLAGIFCSGNSTTSTTNPAKPESDRSQRSEVSAESFDVDRCR